MYLSLPISIYLSISTFLYLSISIYLYLPHLISSHKYWVMSFENSVVSGNRILSTVIVRNLKERR